MPSSPNSSGIDRFTALVLGLIVFACVSMIGGASYLKYQLDRAETILASTGSAANSEQDAYAQLRNAWGYGGFLGLAPKYIATRDAPTFVEMKTRLKTGHEILARLPEKMTPQTRAELTGIAALFDAVLQKMDSPAGGELSNEVTAADLAPLYAVLPTLEARSVSDNADTRLTAQNQTQYWAMLLTILSWFSLIVASGCAVWVYLTLRDKRSAPMRALAQSIQNMAHGDMRTAIWGIERQDMIGELARAMDIARYHFSHLPDVSVLSEQGPLRLRFEGGSRSLFEAMMKAVTTDSENIREQSTSLTATVKQQREALESMSAKVEAILKDIGQRGQTGDKQITQAIKDMVSSTENLKNAHAHAADQLSRLVPSVQDRVQGLADIAQITGKQLTHTLQSMMSSEITLSANMIQSKETLSKLSATADELGERLFGAINLLQASGKVLGETTENIKSQWNNIAPSQDWSSRLDEIVEQLDTLRSKVDAQTDAQFGMAKALEQSAEQTAGGGAAAKAANVDLSPLSGQLAQITQQLQTLQAKLETSGAPRLNASEAPAPVQPAAAAPALSETALASLSAQLGDILKGLNALHEKTEAQAKTQADMAKALENWSEPPTPTDGGDAAKTGEALAALTAQHAKISEQLADLGTRLDAQAKNALAPLKGQFERVTEQLGALHDKIGAPVDLSSLESQYDRIAGHLAALHEKLGEQMETQARMAQETDARKNDLPSVSDKLAELTELNGRVAVFISALPGDLRQAMRDEIRTLSEQSNAADLMAGIAAIQEKLSNAPDLSRQLSEIGGLLAAWINEQRVTSDSKQLELTGKLKGLETSVASAQSAAEALRGEMEKPKPPQTFAMPPEVQKQFLDQWFQMSAQIEASRASLTASISDQLRELEGRVTAVSHHPIVATKSAADYAMQIQIEKQTEILAELVNTLSLLDAHVQAAKKETNAA